MGEKRIALVTGASRGIGEVTAKKLAEQGAYVILNCATHLDAAEAAAEEIIKNGGEAEAVRFSVDDEARVKSAVDEIVARHGRIDILVNNAGINRDTLLVRMSERDFEEVLRVNLMGTFFCTKAVVHQMIRKHFGRIINISSISGLMGNAGQANYSASKAGIIGFTKAAARELAKKKITVNAVAPGFIDTDMTRAMPQAMQEMAAEQIPVGHFGVPEDVARAVCFLASDDSSYITGQVLAVDGGMSM